MKTIPEVKTYRVTVETGEVYTVTAPTRRLAIIGFNLDHPAHWLKSKKIGFIRNGKVINTTSTVK
jgi:hypothetical protein